jgi:single-stranded-DNA-specific exonuclease
MTNKWNYQPPTQEQIHKSDELAETLKLSPTLCLLLVQRDVSSVEEAQKFLHPNLNNLHDPFLMPDMDKAIARLNRALGNKERILIYGDYDVDGTTAVTLVYKFLELNSWSPHLDYYIPDRYDEGYGVSYKGIDYAAQTGVTLIISLDCGIKAVEKVEYAKSKGIDFIICDHHMPDHVLPAAVAVLDAKRTDSQYPYEHLSGCGVGFKFMQAFTISNSIPFSRLRHLLDLVVVSIASDIVPVTGENRILAYAGLNQLNYNPSNGVKGILDICGLTGKEITMNDIVFKIGPRINASGRMMNGKEAVQLMLSKNETFVKEKSENIDQYNDDRRELDKKITDEAILQLDQSPHLHLQKTITIFNPEWHKGVIGIVASRLAEKYYKPVIVMTLSNGMITGSARSIPGFDIYKAIESCKDILENFGGHTYAAGLTVRRENLENFKQNLEDFARKNMPEDMMIPTLDIDMELTLNQINRKLLNELKTLSPHGPDNQKPVFASYNVRDAGTSKLVGKNMEHIKLDLIDNTTENPVSAIAFGKHQFGKEILSGNPFHIAYTIEENTYNGNTTVQLMIKDIKINPPAP